MYSTGSQKKIAEAFNVPVEAVTFMQDEPGNDFCRVANGLYKCHETEVFFVMELLFCSHSPLMNGYPQIRRFILSTF